MALRTNFLYLLNNVFDAANKPKALGLIASIKNLFNKIYRKILHSVGFTKQTLKFMRLISKPHPYTFANSASSVKPTLLYTILLQIPFLLLNYTVKCKNVICSINLYYLYQLDGLICFFLKSIRLAVTASWSDKLIISSLGGASSANLFSRVFTLSPSCLGLEPPFKNFSVVSQGTSNRFVNTKLCGCVLK